MAFIGNQPTAVPLTSSQLADGLITTAKLASTSVTTAKVNTAAITTDKLDLISTVSVPAVTAKGTPSVSDGYIQLNCEQNSHGIKLKSPPHAAGANYTLTFPSTTGTSLQVLRMNTGATALEFAAVSDNFSTQLFHVRDEKSANTGGGSTVTGSFLKRTLNATLTNEISGASISSSVITLPSGTYYINARVPFYGNIAQVKVKLRNTSDSTDVLLGSNSYHAASMINDYWVIGRFTIASSKNFELQYQVALAVATEGLGHPANYGTEVYADCQIWKVA